jgi:DNA (cytosine-5)-methyltransferase 1
MADIANMNHADHELIVDLFAGGGGASTAILMATGRHPDIAINHDKEAIALHEANHPTTKHWCADINEVDPRRAIAEFVGPGGAARPVGLLWASPDCKHHSKARGGKPREKHIRSLAWIVVRWAAQVRPRVIALENVEEFQDWGPLLEVDTFIREDELLSLAAQADRVDAEGHQLMLFDGPTQDKAPKVVTEPRLYKAGQPDPREKGVIFRRWVGQLEKCGYKVEWKELVAADYGAPTTRKRLFLIARCDGQPIAWPERTHAPRDKAELLGLKPWLPAADIIDWSRPVPSIFGRKKPLEPKTLARISKGIRKYVIEAGRPFIVPVTHSTGGARVYDSADPLKTVTAGPKRGEFSLVSPYLAAQYGEREGQEARTRDVDASPYPTVVPGGNGGKLVEAVLGGAVVGCGGRAGQSPPRGLDDPLGTVTAKADKCVAGVFMQKMAENGVGSEIDGPLHTAMAGAPRHYIVAAHLGRQFGTSASGLDIAAPAPTVMSNGGGGKTQVITAYMDQQNGDRIGRSAEEPVTTLTHRSTQQHVAAISIDKYYGMGFGDAVTDPLATVTAKDRMSINASYLEQANTGAIGHDSREPLSTLMAAGSHQRIIECCLDGFEAEPGPRRAEVLAFLWKEFGEPTEAERANPLATAAGRLKFGLVVLDDVVWRIVDIGMRMLVPRELYGAQGFPPDYAIEIQFEGKPLTKTAQTRMAGNSVSPPPAAALLGVNYVPAFAERERIAA